MTNVKFGCQLPQDVDDFDHVIQVARECERLGYDSVWVYDHLSPYWSPSGRALECWTTLSAVAARTGNVKVGSLVTNVGFRNPGLLAKMSSTIDNISGGRLILGLGTGDRMSRQELSSYGYGFPSLTERIERLRETVQILKAMWTQDETTFHGKHFKTSHAVNLPKPKQRPHPPIWIGGKHLRILDVVAELADGWNYWGLSSEMVQNRRDYLSAKCAKYGRKPEDILKSWSGTYSQISRGANNHSDSAKNVVSELQNQTAAGTEYFIVSFSSRANMESYQAFADSVKSIG